MERRNGRAIEYVFLIGSGCGGSLARAPASAPSARDLELVAGPQGADLLVVSRRKICVSFCGYNCRAWPTSIRPILRPPPSSRPSASSRPPAARWSTWPSACPAARRRHPRVSSAWSAPTSTPPAARRSSSSRTAPAWAPGRCRRDHVDVVDRNYLCPPKVSRSGCTTAVAAKGSSAG